MQPINTDRPIDTAACCFLVQGLLSTEECAALREATADGYVAMANDYPASYRDNDRQVRDDPTLAALLWGRLADHLPGVLVDERGRSWRLRGLNERFRMCRYRDGQHFGVHRDGAHARGEERSRLTVMLYLDDAAAFTGGMTRFYDGRGGDARVLGEVQPRAGAAIVFDHALWHDGEAVIAGTKHVLRTDVMYAREDAEPADAHTGYVWALVARRDGSLASASRDRTIVLWRDGAPSERLLGHEGSVTTLAESRDGALWSGSRDRSVRRWSEAGSRQVGEHDGAVLALCALPDGGVASAGADGRVLRWQADGTLRAVLHGPGAWIWSLAVEGDHALLAACEDGTAWRFDLRDPGVPGVIFREGASLRALACAGGRIALGDATGHIELHSPGATTRARVHDGAVCALAWDGARLASCGEDGTVHVLDPVTLAATASRHHDDFVRCLAWRGDELCYGGYDARVRRWDAQSSSPGPALCATQETMMSTRNDVVTKNAVQLTSTR